MAVVLTLLAVATSAGCAPGTPDDDSWRDDAVRVTGDVGSAVSTVELALRHRDRLFRTYLQTVAVDAEEAAGTAATRLEGVQPPDPELDRNSDVTSAIDDATSLLTDVRIAVVRRAPLQHFINELSSAADRLDHLEQSLHQPPGTP
ncbi:hypothetical protein [Nocardioides terrae]|uniref:hypothetical protein n=1 Tax=Nocardioides terrae TaxID=574651 RepID=UPI001113F819|nr:hypothetical protein [Nocardioides terrae]